MAARPVSRRRRAPLLLHFGAVAIMLAALAALAAGPRGAPAGVVAPIGRQLLDPETECSDPSSQPDPCAYAREFCDDFDNEINFLEIYFCDLDGVHWGVSLLMCAVLVAYLFYVLGTTADDYFCPALTVIGELLRLSDDVVGVTLLALGSGVPDMFSSLSAFQSGDVDIALGGLTGAGLFISILVFAATILATPGDLAVMPRPFVRDLAMYWIALAFFYGIVLTGSIDIYVPIVLAAVYGVYVALVLYRNDYSGDAEGDGEGELLVGKDGGIQGSDDEPDAKSLLERVSGALTAPVKLLLDLTVPPVDVETPMERVRVAVFPVLSQPLILFAVYGVEIPMTAVWGSIGVGVGVSVLAGIVAWKYPRVLQSTAMRKLLAPLSFVISGVWIMVAADEIVALLQSVGLVLNISNDILGLTLLAWGNSVGDLFANTALARRGFGSMATAACYAAPLFNLSVGNSVALMTTLATEAPLEFDLGTNNTIAFAALLGGMLLTLKNVVRNKFIASRTLGWILVAFYALFVVISCLVAVEVI